MKTAAEKLLLMLKEAFTEDFSILVNNDNFWLLNWRGEVGGGAFAGHLDGWINIENIFVWQFLDNAIYILHILFFYQHTGDLVSMTFSFFSFLHFNIYLIYFPKAKDLFSSFVFLDLLNVNVLL